MSRVHALPAAVLSVALLVSACSSGGSEPVATPSSSATPTTIQPSTSESSTPTADPTPTAPAVPAAATKNTDAGAEAFARYWVKVLNYAQRTGDVGALGAISTEACEGCRGAGDAVAAPYSEGGSIRGGEWAISNTRPLPLDYEADWGGFSDLEIAAQTVIKGDGSRDRNKPGEYLLYTYPKWTSGAWKMQFLAVS